MAELPAASVAVQDTLAAPSTAVEGRLQVAVETPDVASVARAAAVADLRIPTGFGLTTGARPGAVASRWIVTDWVVVPPALVAEQVNVVPVVSAVTAVAPHPVVDDTAESGSSDAHEMWTSLVYQPFVPSVPVIVGTTVGPVGSMTV